MTTASDQINRALRLIGVLAEGETPSSDTSNDALTALNQMLDSWSTERLTVFCTQDQVFTWPANQATRTIGPTGNFVGNRPVRLEDSTYFVLDGTSFPIQIVNELEYNSIPVKDTASSYPSLLLLEPSFPNSTMTVYPVPSQDLSWHFISVSELSQPTTLTTALSFPPGYLRAFTFNLAVELAPEFGVEPSPQVQRIAMVSKRNLKRINNPMDMMQFPTNLITKHFGYDIYTGNA